MNESQRDTAHNPVVKARAADSLTGICEAGETGAAVRLRTVVVSVLEVAMRPAQAVSQAVGERRDISKRHDDRTNINRSGDRIRGRRLMSIKAAWFSVHPFCVMCRAKGSLRIATELDHIVALVNGGLDFNRDDCSNRQSLCEDCHKAKTASDLGHRYTPRHGCGQDGWPVAPSNAREGEGGTKLRGISPQETDVLIRLATRK